MDGLVGAALLTRHAQKPVVHGVGVVHGDAHAVHASVIVFLEPQSQRAHRGHRAGHADDRAGASRRHRAERLVDVLVDVRDRFGDFGFAGRIVAQVALGHAHGSNVHRERGLYLRGGRVDAVAAQHKFCGAATQVHHQIRGFELAAAHDAGRPEEAQIGLLRSRDDFGAHAEYLLDANVSRLTASRVADVATNRIASTGCWARTPANSAAAVYARSSAS